MRAVARLSPARNPLAYHSDYFGACAVEANGAPRPFLRCRAARGPPGSSAAWRRRFTRARLFQQLGARKKKRSRPGNCARRRSLEMQVLRGRSRLEPLVSLQGASLVGAGHCRGVFRIVLRRPQRRMYPVSGDGETEEHAIFAGPPFVRVRCLQYDARGSPVRSCGETAAEARVARTNPVAVRVQH